MSAANDPKPTSTAPSGRGDALIEVGEMGAPDRALRWLVLGLTLVITLGTAVVDLAFPLELPKLVGRERANDQKRREQARFGDGSLARLLERDLQLKSRVRSVVSRGYTLYLYRLLGEADGAQVVVGKDGWIFVKARTLAPNAPTEKILTDWATRLVALDRALACLGVRTTFIPLPRRSVIEFKRLPDGVDPRREIDREAATILRRHGLEAVNVFPEFTAWEGPSLFYHGDAHWNELAERLTAEETLRQCGRLVPEEERGGVLRQSGQETQGTGDDMNRDLYRLAGIDPPAGSELLRGEDVPVFEFVPTGGQAVRGQRGRQNPTRMGEVALTGTSFSARRKFAMFLEYFGGLRLFDASEMGKGAIEPIHSMLDREEGVLPEWLLAEVPVYTAFQGVTMTDSLSELIMDHPAPQARPFGPVAMESLEGFFPRGTPAPLTRKGEVVCRSRPGSLLSTWDYLFSLRIRGEVLGGGVALDVVGHKELASVRWGVGAHEVHFPLLAPGNGGRVFSVRALPFHKAARFRVDEVEFLTQVDLDARTPLRALESGGAQGRWHADFALEPMAHRREDRALVVGPWSGALPKRGRLRIEAVDPATGEATHILVEGQIAEGGWVFASLGNLGRDGEAIVRFSGAGSGQKIEIEPAVAPVFSASKR